MNINQVSIALSNAKKHSKLEIQTGSLKTTILEFSDYRIVGQENLLVLPIEKGRELYIDTTQITMLNIETATSQKVTQD